MTDLLPVNYLEQQFCLYLDLMSEDSLLYLEVSCKCIIAEME